MINKEGKIPVYDAYEDDNFSKDGEWKEYHTNDIASMKFFYAMSGFGIGWFVGACLAAVYFLR